MRGTTCKSWYVQQDANGAVVPLSKYKDKPVILVVNVARCADERERCPLGPTAGSLATKLNVPS